MNLNLMDPKLIALAVAVVLIIVVAVAMYMRKRKNTTTELREHFGPEYDRAVLQHGSERKAEAKLAARETRVEMLKIRDLDVAERERYLAQWQAVQSRFVDYPKGAVTEADELVCFADEDAWLSCHRFRSAGGGHFRRPSPSGGELPLGARHRLAAWQRTKPAQKSCEPR